jgi:hypothetical protein
MESVQIIPGLSATRDQYDKAVADPTFRESMVALNPRMESR